MITYLKGYGIHLIPRVLFDFVFGAVNLAPRNGKDQVVTGQHVHQLNLTFPSLKTVIDWFVRGAGGPFDVLVKGNHSPFFRDWSVDLRSSSATARPVGGTFVLH